MAFIGWLPSDKSRSGLSLLLLAIVAMTGACTRTYNPPREAYTRYPVREAKIPLRVGLNITDELRQAKWERGDQLMPVGESIAMNAGVLARHVFAEVDVTAGGNSARAVDAILTPLVVYVNRTHGATAVGESITSIKIEWSLQTPSGQPIWIETVSGQSSAATSTDPEKVLEKTIEDVLRKSEEAFHSSRALRVFAASRR